MALRPTSYIGSADPDVIWEMLIGGIVVCSFLAAVALWVFSALRKVKRSQLRRNAFVSSALNNLKPWRGDDGFAQADRVSATTAISRSTAWCAPIFRRT